MRAIGHVILFVHDLEREVAFYRDVLGLKLRFVEHGYAEFESEGTRFALYERRRVAGLAGVAPGDPGPASEVVFIVDDAASWVERLSGTEARVLRGPTDRPWGHRTVHLLDSEGHLVELAEPIPRRRPRGV